MKRYGIEHYHDQGSEMIEKRDGDYVWYADVQALESQVAELQRIAAEVTKERDAARAMLVVADARINFLMDQRGGK